MERSAAQCRFLLTVASPILAGLTDEHLALEPRAGTKTAGWLVGHLAVTGDFARRLCGRPSICPPEWRALFNPGTQPSTDRSVYPPMHALRDALRAVYVDLAANAVGADPALLAKENPYVPARAGFPTAGEFAGYMMTGHFGYHLGQLSTWRAAAGFGPLTSGTGPT